MSFNSRGKNFIFDKFFEKDDFYFFLYEEEVERCHLFLKSVPFMSVHSPFASHFFFNVSRPPDNPAREKLVCLFVFFFVVIDVPLPSYDDLHFFFFFAHFTVMMSVVWCLWTFINFIHIASAIFRPLKEKLWS